MVSRLETLDLSLLGGICPPGRFAPDFMFVWSADPNITIEAQLNDLAQLPAEELHSDLAEVWTDQPLPEPVASLLKKKPLGAARERSQMRCGLTGPSHWNPTGHGFTL
jgi:hypothetical protein